ncbi:MAG: D-lyxose/D-mannose family sugar isomerase [Clostridiales Family XIII bacterium]|jgi:D-lyxose ketol-isomerase|nr:D-lyxose/D-mannose family sugar isomerase [Clostridiales Family XIII bacterium]
MKRSEIQSAIAFSLEQTRQNGFMLPRFAYWDIDMWIKHIDEIDSITKTMLGWDVTDFGNGDFHKLGAVLFTIRNGLIDNRNIGTPYAEKIIVLEPGQRLPIHMHKTKSEDIVSRSGGAFEIRLWNITPGGNPDTESPVRVYRDGMLHEVEAGAPFHITNGNSITLHPYLLHSFGCADNSEPSIIGEISSINNDMTDNFFAEPVSRFTYIEEDEELRWILCNEYNLLNEMCAD